GDAAHQERRGAAAVQGGGARQHECRESEAGCEEQGGRQRGEEDSQEGTTMMKRLGVLGCAVAALALAPSLASAEDALKVAIGQINNWENQAPTLGRDAGIFKKHGLVLENFGTAGAGETLQPIISASADIGAGVGVAGAMRAFAKGAPVRVLLPAFTGT